MRRAGLIALAILASSCEPAAERAGSEATATSGPHRSAFTLAGSWRLVSVDSRHLPSAYIILLRGDDRSLWWEPRCAGISRGYRIAGERIRFGADPSRPVQEPGGEPVPVCAIGPPVELAPAFAALDAARSYSLDGQGRAVLIGEGHEVTLSRRPEIVNATPSPSASRPAPVSLDGAYRLAGIDGSPLAGWSGVSVAFQSGRIEFDNCQQIAWHYRYAEGSLRATRTPVIAIDIAPKPTPCPTPLSSQLAAFVATIDGSPRVARTPANGIELAAAGHSVLLFSQ